MTIIQKIVLEATLLAFYIGLLVSSFFIALTYTLIEQYMAKAILYALCINYIQKHLKSLIELITEYNNKHEL